MTDEQKRIYKNTMQSITRWIKKNSKFVVKEANWYAGITNNEQRRHNEHSSKNKKDIFFWKSWNVKSLEVASKIEDRLSDLGFDNFRGIGGANLDSTIIYVYKKYPTMFD